MEKWEGEVAVVTGASSGIGRSIAIKLAEHGLTVAALARREDKLQELSDKFRGKGCIKAYKCDISKDSDIEEVFSKVEKDLGIIRVLVNNAGICTLTKITDFDVNVWRQMFDVNFFAMFTCIKQVINSTRLNNDKKLIHIININSIAGHQPSSTSESTIYGATKHCVTMLSKGLLTQLPVENLQNVRVTSLSPGVVETEIFDVGGWTSFNIKKIAHLSPEDIANGIIAALTTPENVVVSELTMKPAGELF